MTNFDLYQSILMNLMNNFQKYSLKKQYIQCYYIFLLHNLTK